ncbi:BLUF domain-containing protein [Salinicola aestuarinus]|uniref:BLUF domain-containing protein n=1 Tax=Salinicola aestuarinus TaxID=1949082 RepID=UPI000DA20E7B|nr:BLUF domain-containing protein [Salinicola aestuarinus]
MPERLRKLVYLSHATLGVEMRLLLPEVEDILATSRRRNAESGVTGALMFNHGYFAQVLEGRQDALEATFERIQMDERHDHVSILAYDIVPRRVFESWSMGWVGNDDGQTAGTFAGLTERVDRQTRELAGERIYSLLCRRMHDGGA